MPEGEKKDELLFGFGEDFVWGAAIAGIAAGLLQFFYLIGRFRGRRRGRKEARAGLRPF